MVALIPILKKSYWVLAGLGALYAALILCLCNPWIQRHSLYAHKLASGWWADLDTPTKYGFAESQVTSFNLSTPDEEKLHCWHVMPIQLYAEHEVEIMSRVGESKADFTRTIGYELMRRDPESRLILSFHGNAAHLAAGYRTGTYVWVTSLSKSSHLISCDYRGFGRSTGSPTEAGLITDGIAMVDFSIYTLGIAPQRVAFLGQSLGTAVAAAVALFYSDPSLLHSTGESPPLFPAGIEVLHRRRDAPITFASVILAAPFTSLPDLLHTYRIGGIIPILSALRQYPNLQNLVLKRVVDKWETARRLSKLVQVLSSAGDAGSGPKMTVQIIHARNDYDISFRQSQKLFEALSGAAGTPEEGIRATKAVNHGARGRIASVESKGVDVSLEITKYGGHNRINTFAPIALALTKAFGLAR